MKITILGARGSVPVEGKDFEAFGGATTCYSVKGEMSGEELYLDAGSGIVSAKPDPGSHISLFLSHMHLDHLLGLPFFPGFYDSKRQIDIYARSFDTVSLETNMERLFSAPFWPVRITDLPARVILHDMYTDAPIHKGEFCLDMMEGSPPDGSTIFRVRDAGHSFVFATDFEHNPKKILELSDFALGCDILFYDGQYTEEEYPSHQGFGHSYPEIGIEIARQSGIKHLVITHHAPTHKDIFLSVWEKELKNDYPRLSISFARAGDVITL